jgi:hypothetical protein
MNDVMIKLMYDNNIMSNINQEGLKSDRLHRIYLTKLKDSFDCDVFFPFFDETHFNIVR